MIIKDVVIPFHVKDAPILKYGCDSLKYIMNVENVYIIGNQNPNIEGTVFIHENDIPNLITLEQIKSIWNLKNEKVAHRAGWLYQQFLKLAAPEYISNLHDNFLISDSDIIFVNNPYQNCEENVFPYAKAYTNEYHPPYREQYFRLLKEESTAGFSFINHQMVCNVNCLKELKNQIKTLHNKVWHEAIMDTLNYDEQSNFSEYDLYGNWMIKNHNNICSNINMSIVDYYHIPTVNDLMECKEKNIHIVSAQAWRRQ